MVKVLRDKRLRSMLQEAAGRTVLGLLSLGVAAALVAGCEGLYRQAGQDATDALSQSYRKMRHIVGSIGQS